MKKLTLALISFISLNSIEATSLVRRAARGLVSNRVTKTMVKPVSWITQTQFYKKHPWLVNSAGVITAGFVTKELYQQYKKYTKHKKFNREQEFIAAAAAGNSGKVQQFLDQGVNVNATDTRGNTALIWAAASKEFTAYGIVLALLQAGASVNLTNHHGDTALIEAARNKNTAISYLIEKNANINAQNNLGDTALIEAARHGNSVVGIKKLIQAGATIDTKNKAGKTALQVAIDSLRPASFSSTASIITQLAKAGASINLQEIYRHEHSAILWNALYAAMQESDLVGINQATRELWQILSNPYPAKPAKIEAAIQKGADLNAQNKYGQNAITIFAIHTKNILIKNEFDFSWPRERTMRPHYNLELLIYHGARADNAQIARLKNEHPVRQAIDLAIENVKPRITETLFEAMQAKNHDAVRQALAHPYVNINGNTTPNGWGRSIPLLIFAVNNDLEIARMLLQAGANVNIKNADGETALMCTARRRNEGDRLATELLLKARADVNVMDNYGRNALMEAAHHDNLHAVNLLIAANADVNLHDAYSPLYFAAGNGNLEIVKCLIAAGANVNQELTQRYSEFKQTALLHAAEYRKFDVMRELLRAGAEVNAEAINNFSLKDNAWKDAVWKVIDEYRAQLAAEIGSVTPFPMPLSMLTADHVISSRHTNTRVTEAEQQTTPNVQEQIESRRNHAQAHGDIPGLS